uniref:Uncharacterized protein n=1 Tax=Moniliophthora roreri TaxID=221103 RepID=A0A0W0FXK6_MONRR
MLRPSKTLNTNPWATVRSAVLPKLPSSDSTSAGPANRDASLIIPQLYLSDFVTARDSAEISRLGITHVVSVLEFDMDIPECIPDSHKMHVRIADRSDVDILVHLEQTTEFIRKAIEESPNNNVLVRLNFTPDVVVQPVRIMMILQVHCFAGVSRSATVVCAYLVATAGMRAIDSIAFVQSKRKIVCPNLGFRQQLEMYATYSYLLPPDKKKVKGQGMVERIRRMQRSMDIAPAS